jgi:hypothetical protein
VLEYEGKAVIPLCQNAQKRPIGRTQPRWSGCHLRATRYRISAQAGHLASCDGNKQALAPVGVPPRRFSAVSYIGALCFNSVVSSNRRPERNRIVPIGSHAWGGVVLHVRQPDGNPRAPSDRLHSCGRSGHVWVGCEASQPFLRRFLGVFTGVFEPISPILRPARPPESAPRAVPRP